jgi:signal transduction histidine kinase
MKSFLTCPDSVPSFLGLFDLSVAPPLLFYAYIPIALISIFFGIFVLKQDNFSLRSKLLFTLSLLFFLLLANEIIQWIGSYANVVLFGWQLVPLFRIGVTAISVYFAYNFIYKKDLSFGYKIILSAVYIGVIFTLPFSSNIVNFDLTYCEGVHGILWDIVHILELLALIFIAIFSIFKFKQKETPRLEKLQIIYISLASCLFLLIFFASNAFADLTTLYEVGLLGPIGMLAFLGFLTYMIVKFKAFNVKLIATQALMFALIIVIGSQLFFIKTDINFILTGVTLAMSVIFGGLLIRSVQREVAQREEIENLAKNLTKSNDNLFVANEKLKELNKQKTEFVSIASHQLRSPLTAIKGYTSMLLEGSFGPIEDKARGAIDRVYESSIRLVNVIEDFLNITRIELGRMKYEISVFDISQIAETVAKDQEPNAKKRGLSLELERGSSNQQISADSGKVTQVVSNIIDNSIKYTPSGWIKVKVETLPVGKSKSKEVVRLSVSDSGVGIDKNTMPKLFDKFVRADDAGKTNISGTGLGLYVAKQIVEGLKGKIWAESEGKGKGSTFFVEFPKSNGEITVSDHKIEAYTKADLDKLKKK